MGHEHDHDLGAASDRGLIWAFALNQLLTVGQLAAGIISGSLALVADALHNFNDAMALLIAWIARRVARKQPTDRYTFGYRRAELIGAIINLTALAMVGLYLIYEAVQRFIQPSSVTGWLMMAAAGLALVVDVATVWLLWWLSKGNLNVRAAFIHNLADALASVAVLLGGAAIIWLDWTVIDPILTLLIAGYVLYQAITMLTRAVPILMETTPADFDMDRLIRELEAATGVQQVHHVHVWRLDEHELAMEGHIVVNRRDADAMDAIKYELKDRLHRDFHISHATLEFEFAGERLHPAHDFRHQS